MGEADPAFIAGLQAALARHLGGSGAITGLSRLTAGATKATWAFTAATGAGPLRLVLQQSVPPPADPPPRGTTIPRIYGDADARLMLAAAGRGVPVPPVRFILDDGDGLGAGWVMDHVAGETLGRRIATDAAFAAVRPGLAAACGRALAGIHGIDAAGLDFLEPCGPAAQWGVYRAVVDRSGWVLPVVELGLKWAERHLPAEVPARLVHGDFRNGNLIVDPARGLTAVLDWEVAHLGDPMEDLGWLCVRTWRFGGSGPVGGFGEREDLFAAYAEATGQPVDAERVRFWEVFGCVKWGIMCLSRIHASLKAGERHVEAAAIGRRIEEPLYDFLEMIG